MTATPAPVVMWLGTTANVQEWTFVFGCTDTSACNYDSAAEQSDGSCVYPGDSCDDGFSNTIDDVYQSD